MSECHFKVICLTNSQPKTQSMSLFDLINHFRDFIVSNLSEGFAPDWTFDDLILQHKEQFDNFMVPGDSITHLFVVKNSAGIYEYIKILESESAIWMTHPDIHSCEISEICLSHG